MPSGSLTKKLLSAENKAKYVIIEHWATLPLPK